MLFYTFCYESLRAGPRTEPYVTPNYINLYSELQLPILTDLQAKDYLNVKGFFLLRESRDRLYKKTANKPRIKTFFVFLHTIQKYQMLALSEQVQSSGILCDGTEKNTTIYKLLTPMALNN